MEYNITDFTNKLKEWFVNSALFPYYDIMQLKDSEVGKRNLTNYEMSKQQSASSKHSDRHPVHLQ